jgi:hypothetical protein
MHWKLANLSNKIECVPLGTSGVVLSDDVGERYPVVSTLAVSRHISVLAWYINEVQRQKNISTVWGNTRISPS